MLLELASPTDSTLCNALPNWGSNFVFDAEGFAAALIPQLVSELRPLSRLQATFTTTSAAVSLANARLSALQSTQTLAIVAAKGGSQSGRSGTNGIGAFLNGDAGSGGNGSPSIGKFKVVPSVPVKALELTLHAMEDALSAHFESVQSAALQSAEPACRAVGLMLQGDCFMAAAEMAEVRPCPTWGVTQTRLFSQLHYEVVIRTMNVQGPFPRIWCPRYTLHQNTTLMKACLKACVIEPLAIIPFVVSPIRIHRPFSATVVILLTSALPMGAAKKSRLRLY